MAADTIGFIEEVVAAPVLLLGVSDGAVVALTVALRRPDLVRRLGLAAGIFHHSGWHDGVLDGEPPEFLRVSYEELSPRRARPLPGRGRRTRRHPGTSHGVLVEKPGLCNEIIGTFLSTEPIATFAPIRRKPAPSAGQ